MVVSYIIGTGYYNSKDAKFNDALFYKNFWLINTFKYSNPDKIVVINSASDEVLTDNRVEWINLTKNPLHVKDMSNDKSLFGGWSLSFINSAMYAYSCGCDFIYKEQDCLFFGDVINRIYKNCEGKKMVTGELIDYPNKDYTIELSLMFLKRDFIPIFLSELMAIDKTDGNEMRPEKKFLIIRDKYPNDIGIIDFGYGGNRPFKKEDVFFVQKPRWDYDNKITYTMEERTPMFRTDIDNLKNDNLL